MITLKCDGRGCVETCSHNDFRKLMKKAKSKGWLIFRFKNTGEWKHTCSHMFAGYCQSESSRDKLVEDQKARGV